MRPGATEDALWETTLRRVTQNDCRFEFFGARSSAEITSFVDGEGPPVDPFVTQL